jgi:hypothetical protein
MVCRSRSEWVACRHLVLKFDDRGTHMMSSKQALDLQARSSSINRGPDTAKAHSCCRDGVLEWHWWFARIPQNLRLHHGWYSGSDLTLSVNLHHSENTCAFDVNRKTKAG